MAKDDYSREALSRMAAELDEEAGLIEAEEERRKTMAKAKP